MNSRPSRSSGCPATTSAGRRDVLAVELRPADGGDDAEAFAGELADALSARAGRLGAAVVRSHGPARTIVLTLTDTDPEQWTWLTGVHRVQRIPRNDPRGRRHTSSVTVAVLTGSSDHDRAALALPDVRIDTFRGTGAGGQHRNKTDSAVRVTHVPSGTVVTVLQGRSQHHNRKRALDELARRLEGRQQAADSRQESQARRRQVASGAGSAAAALVAGGADEAKAFTYNAQRDEVVHHATGRTWNLRQFLRGRFDV
jgi:peptide chain release factor 1